MLTPISTPDLETLIQNQTPPDVAVVQARLADGGYPTYLVGGCLRDILRGAPVNDWDLASAAQPEELARVFADSQLLAVGRAFGTMQLFTGQRWLEITTFRAEGAYSDRRHPDNVRFSRDIQTDLSRRDFTINAWAYAPESGLLDPFGGVDDLIAGRLRAVGAPEQRLQEDALRILRALRLAAVLDLTIDADLAAALHAQRSLLAAISPERIRDELMKLLPGSNVQTILLAFGDVLGVPIPEIVPALGFDQHSPWHDYDVWEHSVRALAAASPEDPLIRLALLFHDLGKPPAASTDETGRGHFYGHARWSAEIALTRLTALRFDRDTVQRVARLIRRHQDALKPAEMRSWLRRLGEADLRRLIAIKRGDMSAHTARITAQRLQHLDRCEVALNQVLEQGLCYSLAQLAVHGDDLLASGWPSGPQLGTALEQLLDAVIADQLPNERDALLAAAQRLRFQQ